MILAKWILRSLGLYKELSNIQGSDIVDDFSKTNF